MKVNICILMYTYKFKFTETKLLITLDADPRLGRPTNATLPNPRLGLAREVPGKLISSSFVYMNVVCCGQRYLKSL